MRDNSLEQMFMKEKKFVRGGAFCFYEKTHPFALAIQEMKYNSRPESGMRLGAIAAEEWLTSGFFEGIDLLLPLPLHRRRLRERGYNQAEWIARGVSAVTGIGIDTTHLKRVIDNDRQAHLSKEARKQLPQIFTITKGEELRGKHVLIIDDVVTTGSTIQRAIDVLRPIRGCTFSVFALGLARDQKSDTHDPGGESEQFSSSTL